VSTTLPVLALAVRQWTNDLDPDDYVVSSPKIWRALVDCACVWGPRAGFVETYSTALVTLSNTGSADFTFGGTDTYSNVRDLTLHSNGMLLARWPREQLESAREGGDQTGLPIAYYFHEAAAQQRKIRLYPRPNVADTIDGWTSAFPVAAFTSASTLDFSPVMLQAIVLDVAGKLVGGMDEETLAKLKPGRTAEDLNRSALSALNEEVKRVSRMKRQSQVVVNWSG